MGRGRSGFSPTSDAGIRTREGGHSASRAALIRAKVAESLSRVVPDSDSRVISQFAMHRKRKISKLVQRRTAGGAAGACRGRCYRGGFEGRINSKSTVNQLFVVGFGRFLGVFQTPQ